MSEQINPANLRYWDQLGKTDPAHTKQFQRSGGFKGTAIKPMWCNLRMTEFFGPCGIGWGQTEPQFQVLPAEDEIMVYCTVGLWYLDNGERTTPVYGVGGDKVLTQIFEKDRQGQKIKNEATGRFRTYPQTDDEAFKKAYTDALGNAMKFIGVAADIHMGLFDDNKYVQEMKNEFGNHDAPVQQVQRVSRPTLVANPDAEDPNDYDAHMDQTAQHPEPRIRPAGPTISEAQAKRFFGIAMGSGKSKQQINNYLGGKGYGRSDEIVKSEYEEHCAWAAAK